MNTAILNAIKVAAVVFVAIWLYGLAADKYYQHQYGRYEARVIEYAQKQEARADSLKAWADSLSNERSREVAAVTERVRYVKTYIADVAPPVTPSDSLRDRIIAAQDSIITDLQSALSKSMEVEAALRGALQASEARGDSLLAFIRKPKPKPSKWSIGVSGGPKCITADGVQSWCVVAGVSYKVL